MQLKDHDEGFGLHWYINIKCIYFYSRSILLFVYFLFIFLSVYFCLFLCSACSTRNVQMVRLLVRNGADVNHKCLDGWTALHESVLQNDLELCEVLVEHGAEINSRNIYRVTPLFLAAQCGHMEPLSFLIQKGW